MYYYAYVLMARLFMALFFRSCDSFSAYELIFALFVYVVCNQ